KAISKGGATEDYFPRARNLRQAKIISRATLAVGRVPADACSVVGFVCIGPLSFANRAAIRLIWDVWAASSAAFLSSFAAFMREPPVYASFHLVQGLAPRASCTNRARSLGFPGCPGPPRFLLRSLLLCS